MKIHTCSGALILSIMAATPAFADEAKATAPEPAAATSAAAAKASPEQAAAGAPAAASAYTDAQLLEEFGWYIGKRTGLSELGLSPKESEQMTKGILAALNGLESPYEIQKIGPEMSDFIQKKQTAILETLKNKNLGQAAAFFAKLKEDKNVVELPSGLRYAIVTPGLGAVPKPTDTVKVNYTGTLIDGTVFDSSERQGKPIEFALDKVIPGWTEGLQKIGKGGKIKLFVPPQLGYGDDGRPGIPPGSVLVFDIELLDVTPAAGAAAPTPAK
jgi:FKBP-type peptidyl-prolyl cis-trans isomerase